MISQFAFHEHVKPIEVIHGCFYHVLHDKLSENKTITESEKDFLVFTSEDSVTKYAGYRFDFREFLKEFWVETQHYGIMKIWALNKTYLRKSGKLSGCGKIFRIVEIN